MESAVIGSIIRRIKLVQDSLNHLPHNFHLAMASNAKHRQYQYNQEDQHCRLASLEDPDEALSPTYATYSLKSF